MTSREIAELVEARHNDVVTTIERLFEKSLLRSSRKTRREATGGRPVDVYDLIERDTHLVVAGYSDEHRARVIDRWQALETMVSAPTFKLPQTFAEALRLAAEQAERIEAQALQLAAQRPAVAFVEEMVQPGVAACTFRDFCKKLRDCPKETDFRDWLLAEKIMFMQVVNGKRVMRPFKEWVASGYFALKMERTPSGHIAETVYYTGAGQMWLSRKWHARSEA